MSGLGIASYDIYVSDNGGTFTPLLTGTSLTSTTFTGVDGHAYAFESFATDVAGVRQPTPGTPASTTVNAAPPTSAVAALPPVESSPSFAVTVNATDPRPSTGAAASGVVSIDLYVSIDSGPFSFWTSVPATLPTALYTGMPGHHYGFASLAHDLVGNVQSRTLTADTVTDVATSLNVASFCRHPPASPLSFNEPFSLAPLNLYGTAAANLGPADVTLVGANTGPVRGSLIVSPGNQTITFVKTGGVLAPDTYTLTLRSAANGFVDASGNLLAGNGSPGHNYTTTFTVAPSSAVVVAIPDFARGPGQAVNVPATGSGLPLTISDGTGVTSISLTLTYNPSLLTITGANLGSVRPGRLVGVDQYLDSGQAVLTFTSPTALPAGLGTFATLVASVPNSAPYASKEALVLSNISVNGGAIAATDGDGVHVVAYLGDTTGNGGYSGLDAALISRVVANIDTGFAAFPLARPDHPGRCRRPRFAHGARRRLRRRSSSPTCPSPAFRPCPA